MTEALYVIPDIHGYQDKLEQALARIDAEAGEQGHIVFLGDYVDRGPQSHGVIQTLLDGMSDGRNWTALRGNHDQLFLDAMQGTLESKEQFDWWLSDRMGGQETLRSYGMDTLSYGQDLTHLIPQAHVTFLRDLPHIHETKALFLCHAGIAPGVPLQDQALHDLIWMREPFLSDRRDHGKLIVHGHTPVGYPEHHGNRIALDAGAGWGRDLHVAVFEGRRAWLLDDEGRVPLRPSFLSGLRARIGR